MSSAAKPSSDLTITTVTEDDLRAFQAAHFASNPPAPGPYAFFYTVEASEFNETAEDNLGYYPDGVKRTLTDEQIAMFRHSEIQTLLRERRHAAESGGQAHTPEATADESSTSDAMSREHELINRTSSGSNMQKPSKAPTSQQRRSTAQRSHHKLSTKAQHIAESDPQGRTHRRLARELDNAAAEEAVELDY